MMKKFTLILFILVSIIGGLRSQDIPIDFETGPYVLTGFDGGALTWIANTQISGINTSDSVAQMVKGAGATWAGAHITLSSNIDFSSKEGFSMKVYSPRVGATVLFKLEGSAGPVEKTAITTVANQWETVTFDFTGSTTNVYNRIVLIFDNGTAGDGSANYTFLIDDIDQYEITQSGDATLSDLQVDATTIAGFNSNTLTYNVELPEGTTTVPTVTATENDANANAVITPATVIPGTTSVVVTAEDGTVLTYNVVFSIEVIQAYPIDFETGPYVLTGFDGGALTWIANTQVSGINTSDSVAQMVKGAGAGWAGGHITLSSNIDFSVKEGMSMKVFSPRVGASVLFKLEGSTGPVEKTALTTVANEWETLNFDFTGATTDAYNKIVLIFDLGTVGDGSANYTFLIDDIDQYEITLSGDATLSDLQVDATTIAGFNSNTLTYNVELPEGTTTVPTVTATENDANANAVITPATAIPGTTSVVVTAEDGTVLTYNVVFSIEVIQTYPIDFETGPYVLTGFDGGALTWIANTQVSGINTSDSVAQMVKGAGAGWAGGHITLSSNIDFSVNEGMSMKVFSPRVGASVLFKLEGSTGPVEKTALTTVANEWETLNFDFTGATTDAYNKIVLIFDLGTVGDGSADYTFLIDDIDQYEITLSGDATLSDLQVDLTTVDGFASGQYKYKVVLPFGTTDVPDVTATPTDADADVAITQAPNVSDTAKVIITAEDGTTELEYMVIFSVAPEFTSPQTAAPAPPARKAAEVISVYSDAYASIMGTDFNPDWGQSTAVAQEEVVTKDSLLVYSSLNYQGTVFAAAQDVSAMEYLHVDVWTIDATVIDLFPISQSSGEKSYRLSPLTAGAWNSYDIPVTHFTDLGLSMDDIHQLKIDVQAGETGVTVYFDNIYFYRVIPDGTDASLSDLQIDGAQVNGFAPANLKYEVALTFGTTTVPSVSATATDAKADVVISQAPNVNDTAKVVVTAEDGSTNQEYMVIFSVAPEFASPQEAAPAPPTRKTAEVISVYSDAYASITGTNFNPDWGQSTAVAQEEVVTKDSLLVYTNLNYQGTVFAAAQDVAAMEYLHVDVWTNDATVIDIFPISQSSGEKSYRLSSIIAGAWNSYDIPVTHFTDLGLSMADIHQLKVDAQAGETGVTVYFDNIYFYRVIPDGTDASLSDLQIDGSQVNGFAPTTLKYEVELPFGTTDIPVISADATDSDAIIAFTQAPNVNDTAKVLVTAEDGVTTQEYVVVFSVAPEFAGPQGAAPAPPTRKAAEVISIYSDAYASITGTNFNPGWGQSTTVSQEELVSKDSLLVYTNLNYQGTVFATAQDVSAMEYLHVDVWTNDATVIDIFPISQSTGEKSYRLSSITAGAWNSYDIPVSYFTDLGLSMADIHQLKVDAQAGETGVTVYFDNIYFYRVIPDGTDASLSDLQIDGSQVSGFAPTALKYEVELPFGTTDIPVISADATDSDALVTITQALNVTDRAKVLVTAEDGVTKQEYIVAFSIAPEFNGPQGAAPTPPQRDAGNVVSIFSDAYASLEGTDFNPGWGQATAVSQEEIVANDSLLVYSNLNYQGTQFASAQDVSGMQYLHIDIWTADATVIEVYPISVASGEKNVSLSPIKVGEWNSYDIPLSEFTDKGLSMDDIHQIKVDVQNGETGVTVYFDNIYFYKTSSSVDANALLSNILVDGNGIEGFESNTFAYTVELPAGTSEVPVVTIETESSASTTELIAATELPGTTQIVVTAEDGVSTETYTIAFTVKETISTNSIDAISFTVYMRHGSLVVKSHEAFVNGQVEIFDLNGRLVKKSTIEYAEETIDVAVKGLMIVKISNASNTDVKTQQVLVK